MPIDANENRRPGHRWFLSRKQAGTWLCCFDADYWKAFEHDRWMSDPNQPNTFQIWGERGPGDRLSGDQKSHFSYSKHIASEVETEEVVRGVLKRYWKAKSDTNHYLDASSLATVAASMRGLQIGGHPTRSLLRPADRKTFFQMAKGIGR